MIMCLLNLQSEGKICHIIRLCSGTKDAMILQMVRVIIMHIYNSYIIIVIYKSVSCPEMIYI